MFINFKIQVLSLTMAAILVACGKADQTTVQPTLMLLPSATSTTSSITTEDRIEISKWDLWSSGETLLRGANIYQAIVIPELDGPTFKGPGPVGPPYTQEDFEQLAALGANYVSISGPGIFNIYPPYEMLPEILDYYDQLLEMIKQADMFATLGFRTGPGRADWSLCCAEGDWAQPYLVDSVWQNPEEQAAWADMWQAAAEHFRENPVVVGYKLMVEPNAAAYYFDIYDAETFYESYAGSTYDWNSFFPDIVAAIREVDTETPILVGGDDFSSIAWLPYVKRIENKGVVYYVDQYAPFPYTHQDIEGSAYPGHFDIDYDGSPEDFDGSWLENLLGTIDQFKAERGVPVTVEEYGVYRWAPGAADYLDDLMRMFEGRGLNYAIWEWQTHWEEWASSVHEFNWRFGTDPENLTDIQNPMQDVLVHYWDLNSLRPSIVIWKK